MGPAIFSLRVDGPSVTWNNVVYTNNCMVAIALDANNMLGLIAHLKNGFLDLPGMVQEGHVIG